jgi:hypothetical protein
MKNLNTYLESASTQGWRRVDNNGMIAAMSGKSLGDFSEGEVTAVVMVIHKACTRSRTPVEFLEYRQDETERLGLTIFNIGANMLSRARVDPSVAPEQVIITMSQSRQVSVMANNLYIKYKLQTIDIFRCEDDWFYVRYVSGGGLITHYICDQLPGLLDLIGHLIK